MRVKDGANIEIMQTGCGDIVEVSPIHRPVISLSTIKCKLVNNKCFIVTLGSWH